MSSGPRRGRSSNQGTTLWEVIEIVAENGKLYQVRWAGKDPKTGKPWPLDWIPSSHCSPELVKDWERKKAKKQASLDSAPVSTASSGPVTRKRQSEKRNSASSPETPVRSTRKRRHRTPSGSPDNTDEDSAPPRKKKLTTAVEGATGSDHGQSAAHADTRPSRRDHPIAERSPLRPPLEEIDVWVPTPNAKFGPPKRKRTAGERQVSPHTESTHVTPPEVTPTQEMESIPLPSKLPNLTESQIIALREEEEEDSQVQLPDLQFTSTPPGLASPPTPTDHLPPSTDDARVATEVSKGNGYGSPEWSIRQASGDVEPTDPNVGKAHVSESNNQSIRIEPEHGATKASIQDEGATHVHKGFSPLPIATHISLVNPNPSSSVPSSSKTPSLQKPAQSGPLPIGKPGATPIDQTSSKSEPFRSGNGTLAERRAFEARARLDELRRAGANFGSIAKGHIGASKTSQGPERASPHVILKRVMDSMESPSQSQTTVLRNSGNEPPRSASPSERHRTNLPDNSEAMTIQNKADNDANATSLHKQDDAAVENTQVVRDDEQSSEDEVPPTASSSGRSQSHNLSPQASLSSQLAAALSLLHKKSEEISELRVQVNTLRRGTTDSDANIVHTRAGKTQNSWGGTDYQVVEVQTDREAEADTALESERARWNQEKSVLQDEINTLRGDKARALADVNFFREQYQRASDFASGTRSENEELLARAKLAESQAVNGVALVRSTFEARVAKLEAEVQKHKALSDMLTDRARRTDDDVRYRAACMPELERNVMQLSRDYREIEAELEETQDELRAERRANVRLRRQLASLETKEQTDAADSRKREPVPWNDDSDDEDYRPGSGPSPTPRGGIDGPSPQHQESHGPQSEDDHDAQPAELEFEHLDSVGFDTSAQSSTDDMVYLCRWRPSDPEGYCDAVVASKEELREHVASHHLSCH